MLTAIIATIIGILRWNGLVKRVLASSEVTSESDIFEYKNQQYDKEKAVNAFVNENGNLSEKDLRKAIKEQAEFIDGNLKEKNYDKVKMLKLQLEAYYRQLGEECPENDKCETVTKAMDNRINKSNGTRLFCRKCGTEIPTDSDFCGKCGEKVVR